MTDAEIVDLLARSDEGCFDGEGLNLTKEDVVRLLVEREALLKAAAQLDGWIAKSLSGDLGPIGRTALAALRGAIAKAGQPYASATPTASTRTPPEAPKTEYARLVQVHRMEYNLSAIDQVERELDRVWSTMTDEQKAAEPIVRGQHLEEARDAKKRLAASGSLKCPTCGNPCVSFKVFSAMHDRTSEVTSARCRLGHEWNP